jgi:arylsulfatase A-like enzyme
MWYVAQRIVIPGALLLAACSTLEEDARVLSVDPVERGFDLPPRPIVVFYVDGLRQDVFEELRQQGKLPKLEQHFLSRAGRVRSAVVSVPSVTYANALSMMTGRWPAAHGVWANSWFDRDELRTRNYEDERGNADLDRACPTLFELMPEALSAVIALPFERGVEISLADSATSSGSSAWIAWAMGREETTDRTLAEQLFELGEQAREIGEWPALIAIHLPAVDFVAHEHGSDGAEYRDVVASLDQSIGETLDAFAAGGMLEDLLLVLTSDHGHETTPQSLEIRPFLEQALGVPVLVNSGDDGDTGYIERSEHYGRARVVATTSGEREASLHLRHAASWHERPSLEEITWFASPHDELPARLLQSPAVEFVAVRNGDDGVQLHGRLGSAAIERTRGAGEPLYLYRVLGGPDPLGYDADPELWDWIRAGAHTSREWLDATADHARPDLVPQLAAAFDHPRSGDVVLFAAPGWDFSEHYAGGHGGLERREMIVPMYFAGPGIRAGAEVRAARLVDLVPTLLDLAGVEPPDEQVFDGISIAPQLSGSNASATATLPVWKRSNRRSTDAAVWSTSSRAVAAP